MAFRYRKRITRLRGVVHDRKTNTVGRSTVLVLCPYPEGTAPGQRLRFEQHYAQWKGAGYEVRVSSFWSANAYSFLHTRGHFATKAFGLLAGFVRRSCTLWSAKTIDLVYVYGELAPVGPPILEWLILRLKRPLVYDLDDPIFMTHTSHANRFMQYVRQAQGNERVRILIAAAEEVIVTNAYVKAYAETFNSHVTTIYPTVDLDRYRSKTRRHSGDGLVLGWSGSPSTSGYLNEISDALRELQRVDGVTVVVIGDPDLRIPGLTLDLRPWSTTTELDLLAEIDIGLYPLPKDDWVLGKAGGKLVQYMAIGMPVVAQRIGNNIDLIDDGVNGFLADSTEEWIATLRRLIYDPQLRQRVGAAGQSTATDRYSLSKNGALYLRVLSEALASRAHS